MADPRALLADRPMVDETAKVVETQADFWRQVEDARREMATSTKERRDGVQLQGIPNAPMQGTHL